MLGINVVNALRAQEMKMIKSNQDSVVLTPGEENLSHFAPDEHTTIRIGSRVRLNDETLAEYRAAGISEGTRAAYRKGGTVTQIVTHRRHGWVSIRIRLDEPFTHADGSGGDPYTWQSPGDLTSL